MVCCWFWPAPTHSSNKKKKKAAKANTSAPRRRPTSYSSTDGTPLLAPRPAATSSLYARNDNTYHTTTTTSNNKRVREARPNGSYWTNPPSPKKPKTKSSKYDSSGKLRGRGTKRGPPKPHPDPHPCALCALHHPGHAHRTAHHQHSRSNNHHHFRTSAPAPDSPHHHQTLRRSAPLAGEPGSSTRPYRSRGSGGGGLFAYGTGPVYASSSSNNTHYASPPGAHRRSAARAARPNTAARRSSRRADAPIIDVGTTGTGYTYRPAGPVSYSAYPHVAEPTAPTGPAAFSVRAATNQALESVRRQAFRDQMGRPAAPAPGRRVRWDDEYGAGRRAGGGNRRGKGFPPYGGLDRWL